MVKLVMDVNTTDTPWKAERFKMRPLLLTAEKGPRANMSSIGTKMGTRKLSDGPKVVTKAED